MRGILVLLVTTILMTGCVVERRETKPDRDGDVEINVPKVKVKVQDND
jgi:hypothetical protein